MLVQAWVRACPGISATELLLTVKKGVIPVMNYHQSVVHLGEGTRLGQVELVQRIADDGDSICGDRRG